MMPRLRSETRPTSNTLSIYFLLCLKGTNPGWKYILLDTEGIGSFENTETYDIQVSHFSIEASGRGSMLMN